MLLTLLLICIVALPFAGAGLIAVARLSRCSGRIYFATAFITAVLAGTCVVLLARAIPDEIIRRIEWIPVAGIGVGLFADWLTLLFAVLISVVSVLAILYSKRYIPHEIEAHDLSTSQPAYYGYMLLFTGAMLGMVFAADLIQLYIFWELTSIASFMLIGLNWADEKSRAGAVKAFLTTGIGGLAMLLGFIFLGSAAGTFAIPEVIAQAGMIRESPLFAAALVLVVLGAITKSAQFPFHMWLPSAMVAPTPVSAFLHSATLVAAGVYLMARLHPVFSGVPMWLWIVGGAGAASMVVGGILALRAKEFKQLLAYSTISQYGFVFILLGYAGGDAVASAMFSFFNHGVIKAALFFCAGIVTYATGVKTLGKAGPVWRQMPITFALTIVLALSLGGVPILAGFWMKELFIAATLKTGNLGFVVLGVAAGALTLVYMLRFIYGAFIEGTRDPNQHIHIPARTMIIAPALLAVLTIVFGIWPGLVGSVLAEPAATAILLSPVELDLLLHLDLKLFLSVVVLLLGLSLFLSRHKWMPAVNSEKMASWSVDDLYASMSGKVNQLGTQALQLQDGRLSRYIYYVMIGLFAMVIFACSPCLPMIGESIIPQISISNAVSFDWGTALLLGFVSIATIATLVLRRHVHIVLVLGIIGYIIAAVFALKLAPDVALVQVHVETLVTVLFILALVLIPRAIRERVVASARARLSWGKLILASLIGIGSAWFSWLAIEHFPADPIGPWFNEHAYAETHASDVVAAILVEFRALDTLGEITVFAIATIGVYMLVRMIRKETT